MAKRKTRRRRLPNGFGQISEIKGQNLRKPFRAMVTVGKKENGRPICKMLKPEAYFATYNEAYEALLKYNQSSEEQTSDMKVKELWDLWSEWYFEGIEAKSANNLKAAWRYCHPLYDSRVRDLRPRQIRTCIDSAYRMVGNIKKEASDNTKSRMKILFNMMLDYAVEYGVVDHNYARDIRLPLTKRHHVEKPHIPFSKDELRILWDNVDMPFVKVILINCYSGWRPQEMCHMRRSNVNITDWYFEGGMKTDAGRGRIVPVHSKIKGFVSEFYGGSQNIKNEVLFTVAHTQTGETIPIDSYFSYRYHFSKVISDLRLSQKHRPHDCRKTFVTLAKEADVDEYAIKYMVGHKISDLTEAVYTKRSYDWFLQEIEKIKEPVGIMYK